MASMQFKVLSDITPSDIHELPEIEAEEDINLQFRQQTYRRDEDLEFRRDVIALANAQGGHIVIGIKAEGRRAREVAPFSRGKEEEKRLLHLGTSLIEPRIPAFDVRSILMGNEEYVVIVWVPKSFCRPHACWRAGTDEVQFWIRIAAERKRRMEVAEIRQAVLETEQARERTEDYLERRHEDIREAEWREESVIVYACVIPPREGAFSARGRYLQQLALDADERQLFQSPPGQLKDRWDINWPDSVLPEAALWGCRIGGFQRFKQEQAWHSMGYGYGRQGWKPVHRWQLAELVPCHTRNFLAAFGAHAGRCGLHGPFLAGLFLTKGADAGQPELDGQQWPSEHEYLIEVDPLPFLVDTPADDIAEKLCDRLWHAFGHGECSHFPLSEETA